MHNPNYDVVDGEEGQVMSNVPEVALTGPLMIVHNGRASWTSGENIADADV